MVATKQAGADVYEPIFDEIASKAAVVAWLDAPENYLAIEAGAYGDITDLLARLAQCVRIAQRADLP